MLRVILNLFATAEQKIQEKEQEAKEVQNKYESVKRQMQDCNGIEVLKKDMRCSSKKRIWRQSKQWERKVEHCRVKERQCKWLVIPSRVCLGATSGHLCTRLQLVYYFLSILLEPHRAEGRDHGSTFTALHAIVSSEPSASLSRPLSALAQC